MCIEIDEGILDILNTSAASCNQGDTAGVKSEAYDLGTPECPVIITNRNVLDKIIDLDGVLHEHGFFDDKIQIIIPEWYQNILIKQPELNGFSFSEKYEIVVVENILPIIVGESGEEVWKIHAVRKGAIYKDLWDEREVYRNYIATMLCRGES